MFLGRVGPDRIDSPDLTRLSPPSRDFHFLSLHSPALCLLLFSFFSFSSFSLRRRVERSPRQRVPHFGLSKAWPGPANFSLRGAVTERQVGQAMSEALAPPAVAGWRVSERRFRRPSRRPIAPGPTENRIPGRLGPRDTSKAEHRIIANRNALFSLKKAPSVDKWI